MHDPRHTARTNAPALPLLQPFSFTCTCCEVTENRPQAIAPAEWAIEYIDGTGYAFCPECAIDLPGAAVQ